MGPRSKLAGLALAGSIGLGCGDPEPEPTCVSIQRLARGPCEITRAGAMLERGPEGLVVSQLHEDGSFSELAILAIDEGCYSASFDRDPVSGRMWLVLPSQSGDAPAQLVQFDASGQVEWTQALVHEGRIAHLGEVLHHEGALFVTGGLAPLVPYDPDHPSTWADSNSSLLIERLDLAGTVIWARADYPTPEDPEVLFASGRGLQMATAGLALLAAPPLVDTGPSYPIMISPEDGALLWTGGGHESLYMISEGRDIFLSWSVDAILDDPSRHYPRELEPARSLLERRSATTEALGLSEVAWPGWGKIRAKPAAFGDRIATLVSYTDDPFAIAVHSKDGTLECKSMLELDEPSEGHMYRAVGIEGREQVVVALGVGEQAQEHEPALLVLGPPSTQ